MKNVYINSILYIRELMLKEVIKSAQDQEQIAAIRIWA